MAALTLGDAQSLVASLVQDSASLVGSILATQLQAGAERTEATEWQVANTTAALVGYTRNATLWSGQEIGALVGSFGTFMQDVIQTFEGMAMDYASDLRTELAKEAQTAVRRVLQDRAAALQRVAWLYELGVLALNGTQADPVSGDDCLTLSLLCDASRSLGTGMMVYLGTATGAAYFCSYDSMAMIAKTMAVAGSFTQNFLVWSALHPTPAVPPPNTYRLRCLQENATRSPNPINCTQGALGCANGCGFDPRCRTWYMPHLAARPPAQVLISDPYLSYVVSVPILTLSFPVLDPAPPHALAAVVAVDVDFREVDALLARLQPKRNATILVVLNNSGLTVMGSTGPSCSASQSMGSNLSRYSLLQAAEPCGRALGQWLAPRRFDFPPTATVAIGGAFGLEWWDVFRSDVGAVTYFVLVGIGDAEVWAALREANHTALVHLRALRDEQIARLQAAEVLTRQFLQQAEDRTSQQVRRMQQALHSQLDALAELSQQSLNASQLRNLQTLATMARRQEDFLTDLQLHSLANLADSTTWTAAAVVGIMVMMLLIGAYSTCSVTDRLGEIILQMESVANMHVETLQIPVASSVAEVARIQAALATLVRRLTEYKSYMPSALFHRSCVAYNVSEAPEAPAPAPPGDLPASERAEEIHMHDVAGDPGDPSAKPDVPPPPLPPGASPDPCLPRKLFRKNVAVMGVNLVGFKAVLSETPEEQLAPVLDAYIAQVHTTVAKARGHIDFVVGDQATVTFNAHMYCFDPASTAMGVALELRSVLEATLGGLVVAQLGLAAGSVLAGSCGCAAFRVLVSLGTPAKLASVLAHIDGFPSGAVLVDPSVEKRVKDEYRLRPVDLVAFPGAGQPTPATGLRVYAVEHRRPAGQWLYHVPQDDAPGEWETAFERVVAAASLEAAQRILHQYLWDNPDDPYAVRLLAHVPQWFPHRPPPPSDDQGVRKRSSCEA
eukprot:EG_transcript_1797